MMFGDEIHRLSQEHAKKTMQQLAQQGITDLSRIRANGIKTEIIDGKFITKITADKPNDEN